VSSRLECLIGRLRHPKLTILRHSRLHRFLKTDDTNRGEEAPVFGSRNPLFLTPIPPNDKLIRARLVVGSVSSESWCCLFVFGD